MTDNAKWRPDPKLWEKLKPLAREKRHEPIPAENQLWERLRNRQIADAKFRRQHTIDRFIVDFYCRELKLVIEVDGDIHQYSVDEDTIRQEFLESLGYKVIRFTKDEVLQFSDNVIERITFVIIEMKVQPSCSPSLRSGGPKLRFGGVGGRGQPYASTN